MTAESIRERKLKFIIIAIILIALALAFVFHSVYSDLKSQIPDGPIGNLRYLCKGWWFVLSVAIAAALSLLADNDYHVDRLSTVLLPSGQFCAVITDTYKLVELSPSKVWAFTRQ